jgi:hypothetical protein
MTLSECQDVAGGFSPDGPQCTGFLSDPTVRKPPLRRLLAATTDSLDIPTAEFHPGVGTEGGRPLTACVFSGPANWEVVMIKERAWSIRRLTGRSFLPVIGSLCNLTTDPVANRVYVTNTFAHSVSVLAGSG